MRRSGLDRRLVLGLVALCLIPLASFAAIVLALSRVGGAPSGAATAFLAGIAGVATVTTALVAWALASRLARSLEDVRLGTELMATVNPGHRLRLRPGDGLGALAEEINRLADHLVEARSGLEREVARATEALRVERGKLSAVLEGLGEGVVLATPDGRVTLANRAAHARLGAGEGGLLGRSLFDFVDREKVGHFLDRLGAAEPAPQRFTLHPVGGGVLDTAMTPFFDEPRRMAGFVLVLRDVTGPVRSAEERQRLLAETLRELRTPLSSIRSLSESLLADPALAASPARRLLEAVHAEALRLSSVVRAMSEPTGHGLARPPWHFEVIGFADLAAMTVRRLPPDGASLAGVEVEGGAGALPTLRAEPSALSGARGHLLRAVRARRAPGGATWLRPRRRGRVLQIDAGADGRAPLSHLEDVLDVPLPVGGARMTAREIVQQHAGEVWAYEDGGRMGFRIILPETAPGGPPGAAGEGDVAETRAAGFPGAGLVSGAAGTPAPTERPDFYDFSLFDEMARHVLPADRERLLTELTCVAFDIETTGLHPEDGDRAVSIAGVRVRGGAVRRGETFDALINPRRPIPDASVRFHGITDAMVTEAPPVDVVLPAFLGFAEGAVLVGHQVWFDVQVLAMEAGRLGLPPVTLAHPVVDTLALSEVVHGSLRDHGLDAVAERLGVTVRGRHSALGDALTTAEVFVRLVELLRKRGIVTLGQAIDAARAVQVSRADDVTPGAGP